MKDWPVEHSSDDGLPRWRSAHSVGLGCFFLGVTLTAGLGFMQRVDDAASPGAGSGLVVNTVVARTEESLEESRSFLGVVRARRTSELGFERAGRVVRLLVSEGDAVQAGEEIAELDQRRLELKKTNLENASQRARTALEALDPEVPAVFDLQAAVRQLQTELDVLSGDLARAGTLQRFDAQSLSARITGLERRLAILNEKPRRQRIDEQRQILAELDGQLKDLELELEAGTLRAPFDGMVARRHVSQGSVVSTGMPIVRLVEQQSREAWVGIPVDMASRLKVGEEVLLNVVGETFAASVKAKLPELDRTRRTRTVIFAWDASLGDPVLPGEVARVQLRVESPTSGIWLPLAALTRDVRGLWSVLAVEGAQGQQVVTRRIVELLHAENGRAFVRGTLDDGDLVIANGTHRVVPGQRVRSRDVSSAFPADGARRDAS